MIYGSTYRVPDKYSVSVNYPVFGDTKMMTSWWHEPIDASLYSVTISNESIIIEVDATTVDYFGIHIGFVLEFYETNSFNLCEYSGYTGCLFENYNQI